MLYFAKSFRQPRPRFIRMIIKRSHSAAIRDMAILANNVNPLGPRRISIIRRVIYVIDSKRQGIVETLDEIAGDRHALFQRFWLRVTNVILDVRFHLPLVSGMRFAHVDRQKIRVIFVIVVNLRDIA